MNVRTRLALLALFAAAVPALGSGCFFLFLYSTCVEHEHCPSPEQCQTGVCLNPAQYLAAGLTAQCTDDSQCPESECYEGYCIITAIGGEDGCTAHSACPVSGTYCTFEGQCSTAGEETVYEAEDPVLETIVIDTDAELDQALAATVIAGDLYIGTDIPQLASQDFGRTELVFPNLHTITGQLFIVNQASTTLISLPALERVGGISLTIENNAALQEIDMGNLRTVEDRDANPGVVSISGNPSLNRANFTLLDGLRAFIIALDPTDAVTAPGPVTLYLNSLTNVTYSYGVLAFSGTTFNILQLGAVTTAESYTLNGINLDVSDGLTSLTRVDDLSLENLTGTEDLQLPLLSQVTSLDIENTTAGSIELNRLTEVGSLSISDNPNLDLLIAPQLAAVEFSFTVSDNPLLDVCAVKAIADGITFEDGASVDFEDGNLGDVAACP
jgi:hypothetical protein